MAQRKPYNPNTKYGRKKIREEFQHRYNNEMTPEERRQNDSWSAIMMLVIIAIVLFVIYLFSGTEGVVNYLKK